jgi:transposase
MTLTRYWWFDDLPPCRAGVAYALVHFALEPIRKEVSVVYLWPPLDDEGMMQMDEKSMVSPEYRIPDKLWARIEPLIPPRQTKSKRGRPPMDNRKAMNAIFYVLRTGCQWKALPRSLGAASTVHDRFQAWREAGVFERMWQVGVLEYDKLKGLDWEWQAMDGAMTKAPLGGKRDWVQSH